MVGKESVEIVAGKEIVEIVVGKESKRGWEREC